MKHSLETSLLWISEGNAWQSMWYHSVSESEGLSVMSDSLWPHGLISPWNSPGQNTGVGSLSLLQRIFPTQGSNSGLPHCRQILYQLNHQGIPRKTGAERLSLLQWIFLTQEWNWGLLHCRQMLYQLNYQGSPMPYWTWWKSVLPVLQGLCATWLILLPRTTCKKQFNQSPFQWIFYLLELACKFFLWCWEWFTINGFILFLPRS